MSRARRVRPEMRAILAVAGYRSGHDLAHKSADRCKEVLGAPVGADVLSPGRLELLHPSQLDIGIRSQGRPRAHLHPVVWLALSSHHGVLRLEAMACGFGRNWVLTLATFAVLATPSAKDAVTGLKAVR